MLKKFDMDWPKGDLPVESLLAVNGNKKKFFVEGEVQSIIKLFRNHWRCVKVYEKEYLYSAAKIEKILRGSIKPKQKIVDRYTYPGVKVIVRKQITHNSSRIDEEGIINVIPISTAKWIPENAKNFNLYSMENVKKWIEATRGFALANKIGII
jgi:hypothetical protein